MEQRIVCAAVRFTMDSKTFVVTGVRHHDKLMNSCIEAMTTHISDPVQGFVDSHGDFLTREEAWVVAAKARQILRRVGGDGDPVNGGRLFSENLY